MEACQSSALMHEERRTQSCDSWCSMNFGTALAGDVDEDCKIISQRSCCHKSLINSAFFMNSENNITRDNSESCKIGKFGKHLFAGFVLQCFGFFRHVFVVF